MNERRTHIRFPFDGKAYLTYNGRCRCEDVVDVSAEGLQLQSSARLEPGKPIKVFLPMNDLMEAHGTVWPSIIQSKAP